MDPIKIPLVATRATPPSSPGCRFAGPLSQRVGSWLAITVGLPGRVWVAGTCWIRHFKGTRFGFLSFSFTDPLSFDTAGDEIHMEIPGTSLLARLYPAAARCPRRKGVGRESSHPPVNTPMVWSQACDFIPYIHHGFCGVFTVVWMADGIIPDNQLRMIPEWSWMIPDVRGTM